LFRSGEKEILLFLISIAEKFIPLLDMDFKVRVLWIIICLDCEEDCVAV
jgi:hypothetical protein